MRISLIVLGCWVLMSVVWAFGYAVGAAMQRRSSPPMMIPAYPLDDEPSGPRVDVAMLEAWWARS